MFGEDIDIESLRKDMLEETQGAFFGGGFGGALVEASDIKNATDERLVMMAKRNGIDLRRYKRRS